jgi:hypothetical protein
MVSPPGFHRESIGADGISVCIKDSQFNVGVLMVGIEDAERLVASKLGRWPVTAGGNVSFGDYPSRLADTACHLI